MWSWQISSGTGPILLNPASRHTTSGLLAHQEGGLPTRRLISGLFGHRPQVHFHGLAGKFRWNTGANIGRDRNRERRRLPDVRSPPASHVDLVVGEEFVEIFGLFMRRSPQQPGPEEQRVPPRARLHALRALRAKLHLVLRHDLVASLELRHAKILEP